MDNQTPINFFSKYKKHLLIALASAVFAILAVFSYLIFFQTVDHNSGPKRFVVSLNMDTKESIIASIKSAGFVKNSFFLNIALLMRDVSKIDSGAYKISESMTVWQIAGVLSGKSYMKWVVIPEGLRKEEIADILSEDLGWTTEEKNKWINVYTASDPDYIEGVYFPDTYLIPIDESPSDVAKRLRTKFEEKFSPYAKEVLKQDIKWTTLLKLASIVQREARGKEDMPLVAGILWNRLLKEMRLEVDCTLQYIRGDKGKGFWAPINVEDKKIDSPYNTYKYGGLPPHPISNPGINAIEAILYPEKTDCMFYIHDSKGIIHCALTYDEHLKNIKKYLK